MFLDLESGQEDAQMALLLLLCRRLESLDISTTVSFRNSWVKVLVCLQWVESHGESSKSHRKSEEDTEHQRFLDSDVTPRVTSDLILYHLRTLTYRHQDTDDNFYLHTDDPFLRLPRLLTLHGVFVGIDDRFYLPRSKQPPKLQTTLRCLDLTSSTFSIGGLTAILRASPQLDSLSIHCGNHLVGSSELDFPGIGEVLRLYGRGLCSLSLDARAAWENPYENPYEQFDYAIGSLQPLDRLRSLRMAMINLAADAHGVQGPSREPMSAVSQLRLSVPKSVRELIVLDNNFSWKAGVEEMHALASELGFQAMETTGDERIASDSWEVVYKR